MSNIIIIFSYYIYIYINSNITLEYKHTLKMSQLKKYILNSIIEAW